MTVWKCGKAQQCCDRLQRHILTHAVIVSLQNGQRIVSARCMRIEAWQGHRVVRVDGWRHAVDAAQQLASHQRHHAAHWTVVYQRFSRKIIEDLIYSKSFSLPQEKLIPHIYGHYLWNLFVVNASLGSLQFVRFEWSGCTQITAFQNMTQDSWTCFGLTKWNQLISNVCGNIFMDEN